uniref:Uncharacterized protein n=1 Tax=Rhizophora mucronata TaxID=61149 RepID=A0A2P2MR76_RHIMU
MVQEHKVHTQASPLSISTECMTCE